MTKLYPIALETEESDAVSAHVPGLPVYAAADSHAKAERAIRTVLTEYLNAHPASRPDARVRVARVSDRGKPRISVVGVAALVGAKRSDAKASASRANAGSVGALPRTRLREQHGGRHRANASPERRSLRPSRSPPQPLHQPQPPVDLVPTREILDHHY